jgi:hypothetical protein
MHLCVWAGKHLNINFEAFHMRKSRRPSRIGIPEQSIAWGLLLHRWYLVLISRPEDIVL